jgi:hypothetical protein
MVVMGQEVGCLELMTQASFISTLEYSVPGMNKFRSNLKTNKFQSNLKYQPDTNNNLRQFIYPSMNQTR